MRTRVPLQYDGFGAAFYPEQQPQELIEPYIRRLAEAEMQFVRLAEFAWDKLEPQEGCYCFDWLDDVIDRLSEYGIKVILCTPTAAPPVWLTAKHPDVFPTLRDGKQLKFGTRQYTCLSSAEFRSYSRKIARAMAEHYRDDERIHSWQIDNEVGIPFCFCQRCLKAFQDYAQDRFKDIKTFNDRLHTHFWGQTYQDFSQIVFPTEHNSPSMWQLYHQFRSFLTVDCYNEQVDELRRAGVIQPVTTNMMLTYWGYDHREMQKKLDYVCGDSYYCCNVMGNDFAGDAFLAAYLRGIKPESNIRYAEFQCTREHNLGYMPPPGEVGARALAHIALGADHICFFRWDNCLAGSERDEYGLLRTPYTPGRIFDEVKAASQLANSWKSDLNGSTVPVAEAAFLYSYPSQYDLGENPPCPEIGKRHDNGYPALMCRHFRALLKCGITSDIVFPDMDFSRYKVLILSACFCISEELSCKLQEYVQNGGTLLVFPLTGIADELSVMPLVASPAGLTEVCGVKVVDRGRYNEVMGEIRFRSVSEKVAFPDLPVTCYFDELIPDEDTEILAEYSGSLYNGIPAMTCRTFGKGKAVYVGSWFESDCDMKTFYDVLSRYLGLTGESLTLPEDVYTVRRIKGETEFKFLINYAPVRQSMTVADGKVVELLPYEVKLLKEELNRKQ